MERCKKHYRVTITGGRTPEVLDTWAVSESKAISNIKFRQRKKGINVDFTSRYSYKAVAV